MRGKITQKNFNRLCWGLVAAVVALPLLAWLQDINWRFDNLTVLKIFPLLGVWAWLLMWTHYVTGAFRLKYDLERVLNYSKITGYVVLGLILLHPTLLAYGLYDLGLGLPPGSTQNYVGEAQKLVLYFGVFALILFLSYEVLRHLKDYPLVRRNWIWVSYSQALAMILIFVHGLRLGGILEISWMRVLWLLAGVILIPCAGLIISKDYEASQDAKK